MGRGDKKSKKGKIAQGSFGVSRSKNATKARLKRVASVKKAAVSTDSEKPKKTTRKKADA